jgi:hypothetical protein
MQTRTHTQNSCTNKASSDKKNKHAVLMKLNFNSKSSTRTATYLHNDCIYCTNETDIGGMVERGVWGGNYICTNLISDLFREDEVI